MPRRARTASRGSGWPVRLVDLPSGGATYTPIVARLTGSGVSPRLMQWSCTSHRRHPEDRSFETWIQPPQFPLSVTKIVARIDHHLLTLRAAFGSRPDFDLSYVTSQPAPVPRACGHRKFCRTLTSQNRPRRRTHPDISQPARAGEHRSADRLRWSLTKAEPPAFRKFRDEGTGRQGDRVFRPAWKAIRRRGQICRNSSSASRERRPTHGSNVHRKRWQRELRAMQHSAPQDATRISNVQFCEGRST